MTAALWSLCAAMVLARGALVFVPSMRPWGLNVGRFTDPLVFWPLWGVTALALVPSVARTWMRGFDRLGDAIVEAPAAYLSAAVAGGLTVFALPDRTWFEGDFLQRVGAAVSAGSFSGNFVGALPIDYLLHAVLGGAVGAAFGGEPTLGARIFGAFEAGALAALAVALARWRGERGAGAVMVVAVVFFAGTLTMFTGLGKPASEMCLWTAAIGIMAMRADGAGLAATGAATALALLTHRSGVVMLPVWAFAWVTGAPHLRPGSRRTAILIGLVLPVLVGVFMFRRITGVVLDYDLSHHLATAEVAREGGLLAAAIAPFRIAEIANLLIVLAPAIVLVPVALGAAGRSFFADRGARMLAALAAAYVPVWVFVHPQQGVFRDWDVFAAAAVSLNLLAAAALGAALRRPMAARWLAVTIAIVVTTSSLTWLVHFHDPPRGFARVRAYAIHTPPSPAWVHALAWDFLTVRNMSLGRWKDAEDAAVHAVALGPHRRALIQWGIAATMAGDEEQGRRAYTRVLATAPDDPIAWIGLGGIALRTGDSTGTRRALEALGRYAPESPEAREIRRHLEFFPGVWPGTLPANLSRP